MLTGSDFVFVSRGLNYWWKRR